VTRAQYNLEHGLALEAHDSVRVGPGSAHFDDRCTECLLWRPHTWAEHDASTRRYVPVAGEGRVTA
jgi:hypothetical protein